MKSQSAGNDPRALVIVFDGMETAAQAVLALREAGFPEDRVELVTHGLQDEAPGLETPAVHETTPSRVFSSAGKWGGVGMGTGAAVGLVATAVSAFPGLALGMIAIGGLTGAFMGGIAGVEDAATDDEVDLPTIDEYEELIKQGHRLVVVRGDHASAQRAHEVIAHLPFVHSHIHALHGHEFHEHPLSDEPPSQG